MKQNIALILFLILPLIAKAQNAYTINCLSNDFSNNEFTLISSVGNPISAFVEKSSDEGNEFLLGFIPLNQEFIVSGIFDGDEFQIGCYPNPVSSILNIIDAQGLVRKIRIIDLQGREVQNKKINTFSIDLSLLKPGFYMVHLLNNNDEVLKASKIIKL